MNRIFTAVVRGPQCLLVVLVKAYRVLLSPWLGSACRFEPTCSNYALGALEKHGAFAGTYLTLYRLARCQPWCDGGHDPVPQRTLFTSLADQFSKQPTSPEKKSS